jgi:hypothetical protein
MERLLQRGPLAWLWPRVEVRAPRPVGAAQEIGGVVAQVVDPRVTPAEGGRQASAGHQFLTVTAVIDNQSTQAFTFGLSDWRVRDASGRARPAEAIRAPGWLSGGTLQPGQSVLGTVTFLIPEGETQPQVTFSPTAARTMLRWNVPTG